MTLVSELALKTEVTLGSVEVITKSGDVNCIEEMQASSIEIHNAGDETVLINRGRTLRPGHAVSYGSATDYGKFVGTIHLSFDGSGSNPRIEITPIVTKICP